MALEPGTRLGRYVIVSLVGSGGMGKVYRARDAQLGREVAIKLLADEVAQDRERLVRFEREARVLASVNHPNVATLHGFEKEGETSFLVMELVEGETLADRIARGPIAVEEATPLFIQIAEGLEAAHDRGVIHRDLKPANVKVTAEGRVKILDFGLAKLSPTAAADDLSASPTLSMGATRAGVLLGTAFYMSPEQARGQEADQRSDIWGFGCTLFEALSGRRPFAGDAVTDTLARVLEREPDWKDLPDSMPDSLVRTLRRCLAKDPRERAHHIADVRLDLQECQQIPVDERPARRAELRVSLLSLALGLLAGAALAGILFWGIARPRESVRPVTRTILSAPPSAEPFVARWIGGTDVSITPDGAKVVYLYLNEAGYHNLYLRAVDRLSGTPLTDDFGFANPFVSPDGAWVGFSHQAALKKMPLAGGRPVTLCAPGYVQGASWGPDDSIIFVQTSSEPGLYRIDATGGEAEALVKLDADAGETAFSSPEILPHGDVVLFTVKKGQRVEIQALHLGSRVRQTLIAEGTRPRYASSGHLVYGLDGDLFAVPFDPDELEVVGDPVRVVEGVATELHTEGPNFALSRTGTLAYIAGESASAPPRRLVWVDRQGREEPLLAAAKSYEYARISPDGRSVALQVRGEGDDIWIWDLERETLAPATTGAALDTNPVWSPDGRKVFFTRSGGGFGTRLRLYETAADGSGAARRVTDRPAGTTYSVSTDAKWLIHRGLLRSDDLHALSLEDHQARVLLQSDADERNGELSPDDRWLAYESNVTGRFEIYVRPFPDVEGGRWQISSGGGQQPLWSRDGRELFYYGPSGLMAVPVETADGDLRVGRAELLFERRFPRTNASLARQYDVSTEGQRFLMIEDVQTDEGEPRLDLVLVENWFEELERLVPTDG